MEYSLNAVNLNMHLGDNLPIPFQVFIADFASSESPEDENNAKLLDATQGVALRFPVVYRYQPKESTTSASNAGGQQVTAPVEARFCRFQRLGGSCSFGGDITLRGVPLKKENATGGVDDTTVFGASASFNLAVLFPIFPGGVQGTEEEADEEEGKQEGHLGVSVGARYYYHNTDDQDLLFGNLQDPAGNPIEFKKSFAGFSAESEFDLYKSFKIRLEYFRPLENRDVLDDVFKASIVLAPKQ